MRTKAKLVHKYTEANGVSANTGNPWRRQDIKFQILNDDWTEKSESIVVSCSNAIYLDAPALQEGAIGILSFWANAEEFNGRCYNRFNLNGWTPQSEAGKIAAEQQAANTQQPAPTATPAQPQFTPQQLAAAAAMLQAQQQAPAPQNGQKSDLPF